MNFSSLRRLKTWLRNTVSQKRLNYDIVTSINKDLLDNINLSEILREVQGQKSWKYDFEITVDPKGPPSGSTFWLGFKVPDPLGSEWGYALFRPKKSKRANNAQNNNFS